MKPRPYFINTNDQTFGSSAVSVFRKFGKKLTIITTGVTHDVLYVAEQGFNQVLHMRNKYRSHLDMNKTDGNARRLKLTKLQPASKKLTDETPWQGLQLLEPTVFGKE